MTFIYPILAFFLLFHLTPLYLSAQSESGYPNGKFSDIRIIDIAKALESTDVVDMTDYFTSIEYVALGEGEVWLPSAVNFNLIYADQEYYYMTFGERKNRGCFKFSNDGKYVTSFIEKGTWTHKFISIDDTAVDGDGEILAFSDDDKILFYTTEGGYITTIFAGYLLKEAGCVIDLHFAGKERIRFIWQQHNSGKESEIVMDLKGNLLCRRTVADPKGDVGTFVKSQIYGFNGKLKLFSTLRDTVYLLNDKFEPAGALYYLNFGEFREGKSAAGYKYRDLRLLLHRDIMESRSFIIFEIIFPFNSNRGIKDHRIIDKIIYDKISGKCSLLRYYDALELRVEGFNNNLDGGAPFLPSHLIGDKMYQFIDAQKFIDLAAKCRSAKMKEVASKLKPDSNPVMVVAKLK